MYIYIYWNWKIRVGFVGFFLAMISIGFVGFFSTSRRTGARPWQVVQQQAFECWQHEGRYWNTELSKVSWKKFVGNLVDLKKG